MDKQGVIFVLIVVVLMVSGGMWFVSKLPVPTKVEEVKDNAAKIVEVGRVHSLGVLYDIELKDGTRCVATNNGLACNWKE